MKKLILEPYCDNCPFFEAETMEMYYHDNRLFFDRQIGCCYKHQCAYAVEKYKELQKENKYRDPFGNPIYVYVHNGNKTVAIKADDLQKALDYVTEHGEEYTIVGRINTNEHD